MWYSNDPTPMRQTHGWRTVVESEILPMIPHSTDFVQKNYGNIFMLSSSWVRLSVHGNGVLRQRGHCWMP